MVLTDEIIKVTDRTGDSGPDQKYGGKRRRGGSKRRRSTRRGGRKSHRGGKRRSCKKH